MRNYKKYHYYKSGDMYIMSRSNYLTFEKCHEFPEIPKRIKRREIPRGATVLKTWLVPFNWELNWDAKDTKPVCYVRYTNYEELILNWKG